MTTSSPTRPDLTYYNVEGALSGGQARTTKQLARVFGIPTGSMRAFLANRSRCGKSSRIYRVGVGLWKLSNVPLAPLCADQASKRLDMLLKEAERDSAGAKVEKPSDEAVALAGLEALGRLNGSAAGVVAKHLVRLAFSKLSKPVKFATIDGVDAAKVRSEVATQLAATAKAFDIRSDHFTVLAA